LAAVKYLKNKLEENEQVRLFSDLSLKNKKKQKPKVTLLSLKSASSVS
jgi:hypothetical protein